MSQHSGSATLPRGFRFASVKTPEPSDNNNEGTQIPSPPRPRLRLKRRNVSHHLSAPTQQFLASVAAADIPIPSIEEPETRSGDYNSTNMQPATIAGPSLDEIHTHLLAPRGRTFSPPKTPMPGVVPSLSPPRYPNWTIDSALSSSVESTPDCESSRPSTSRSTQTSVSLFSRLSHLSDDDCASPEFYGDEKLVFRDEEAPSKRPRISATKPRKAPWTKAMSTHLWSTYVLYLQDPKVTPFRIGTSCIPPHGVCLRVAREAKRSWKGSNALKQAANPGDGKKSGSSTPTAESAGAYMEWPHTCAATRAHFRELCKLKAASGVRNLRPVSQSPAPFTQAAARHWNRRSTPARSPSAFATQDISMSLALSTSETMQPNGPLAQLTSSNSEHLDEPHAPPADEAASSGPPAFMLGNFEGEPSFAERRRLGSPFGAKSYGPSSSSSLAAALGLNSGSMPRRQTHTVGPRRTLQSPVRLSRSGTQRRRNTQSGVPRKRPSLVSDIWLDPNANNGSQVSMAQMAEPSFAMPSRLDLDELFIPRAPPSQPQPQLASSTSMPDVGMQQELLEPPLLLPPRLGSPFSGTSSSFSFPRRMHRHQPGSVDLGMLGRPFATVQQPTEAAASSSRANLTDRLAYIDQRLKEFRSRDARRRSGSPL